MNMSLPRLLVLSTVFAIATAFAQPAAKMEFVCPMRCDNLTYEKEGACTVCGMALIEKSKAQASASSSQSGYVCPPCGNSCDNTTHQNPGACPVCGMTLVELPENSSLTPAQTGATNARARSHPL